MTPDDNSKSQNRKSIENQKEIGFVLRKNRSSCRFPDNREQTGTQKIFCLVLKGPVQIVKRSQSVDPFPVDDLQGKI